MTTATIEKTETKIFVGGGGTAKVAAGAAGMDVFLAAVFATVESLAACVSHNIVNIHAPKTQTAMAAARVRIEVLEVRRIFRSGF